MIAKDSKKLTRVGIVSALVTALILGFLATQQSQTPPAVPAVVAHHNTVTSTGQYKVAAASSGVALAPLEPVLPAATSKDSCTCTRGAELELQVQPKREPPGTAWSGRDPAVQPTPEEDALIRNRIEPFNQWARNFSGLGSNEERAAALPRGIQEAAVRREVLRQLIASNPQLALQQALPYALRKNLPAEVARCLEERVSAQGTLGVVAVANDLTGKASLRRIAEVDGNQYEAYVYGRRLNQPTRANISLHGIALDGQMAVSESPLRELEPGEPPAAGKERAEASCPVSGKAVEVRDGLAQGQTATTVESGRKVYYLCSGGHLLALADQIEQQESAEEAVAQSAWTTGNKTVLIINVRFSDVATAHTAVELTSMMSGCDAFMQENSYGATSMTSTFTPLLTLPQTQSYYTNHVNGANQPDGDYVLRADAQAASAAAGYPIGNYTLDAVCWIGGPGSYGGQAYVGARGCWLKSTTAGVAAHEFGHNFGLWHANYWTALYDSIIGPGSNNEYGDIFDTMGSAGAGIYHYTAYEKNKLDWLPTANVTTVASSGTYRITAYDQPALSGASKYALKFAKTNDSSSRTYWVDFRQQWSSNTWAMSGAFLHWASWGSSNGGGQLLDTTPGTSNGKNDSAIVIGRTFADKQAGIYVTPIGKGGTSPESLDVVVNMGAFPGNKPPVVTVGASAVNVGTGVVVTFTATASDPNNDTLAYYWDFGDNTFGTNSASASHSWSSAAERVVRCTVTDMKGGEASDSVIIRIGSPSTFRISGTVTKTSGFPVQGARVFTDLGQMTYTDSDGTYTLVGLSAGSYTLGVTNYPAPFTPSGFTNPVSVGPNATGKNFTTPDLTGGRDFNGDGFKDILFRHSSTGEVLLWLMN